MSDQANIVNPLRIGELLISKGLISESTLNDALELQKKWGSRLGEILLAKGWIRAFDFYQALAVHHDKPFVNLTKEPADHALMSDEDAEHYYEMLLLPWRVKDGVTLVAMSDPSPKALEYAKRKFGEQVDFVITSKFDILWSLQKNEDKFFSQNAVDILLQRDPEHSAAKVFSTAQLVVFMAVSTIIMVSLTIWTINTLIALNFFISMFLIINFGLKVVLTWIGSDRFMDISVTNAEVKHIDDRDLPIYTVLVPMFKEGAVLPFLAGAMRKLDYPLSKLDIKLILEETDLETLEVAKSLGLESIFEIIRVPYSLPQTKPKACNYALNFARGKYVTIFDAEDRPEPDQLKKAVVCMSKMPENVVCIQARLNYFNSHENWITKQFTLEYSLWYDFYLLALERLGIPIPLGGTSNHFKIDKLREVGAWDPYNVTEDADLGVRFTMHDLHVAVVNSSTYEEANSRYGNWFRQRSRWLKGYMQTWLVYMRHPIRVYKQLGHIGFWGFQFFIGGTVFSVLVLPFLYAMIIFYTFMGKDMTSVLNPIFPPLVLYLSMFNLLAANGFLIYVSMLGAFKRHNYQLIPLALTTPVYWLMMSIAAYKGLWQLINKPFFWEKTLHGISAHSDIPLEAIEEDEEDAAG